MHNKKNLSWIHDDRFVGGVILTQGKKFMEWAKISSLKINGPCVTIEVSGGWYECKIREEGAWSSHAHTDKPLHVELENLNMKETGVVEFSVNGLGLCQLYPKGAIPFPEPGTRDLVVELPPEKPRENFT